MDHFEVMYYNATELSRRLVLALVDALALWSNPSTINTNLKEVRTPQYLKHNTPHKDQLRGQVQVCMVLSGFHLVLESPRDSDTTF